MVGSLQQLRHAIVARKEVEVDEHAIKLGSSVILDRKAKTNFHSMRGRGGAYLLETVYFQFKFRELPYNDYVQACSREGVAHVISVDKKDLVAYLTGEISQCPGLIEEVDSSAPKAATHAPEDAKARSSEADIPGSQSAKGASLISATQLQGADVAMATLRMQHRDQRALDSVLMLAEWDFSAQRDKLAKHIEMAKKGKINSVEKASARPGRGGSPVTYDPRGDRYTSNEDRFWRENMGSDFQELGINPAGSFKKKSGSSAPAPEKSSSASRQQTHSSRSSLPVKRKAVDYNELRPIIVVPTRSSALITSTNAKEFLQNGRFVSEDEMRSQGLQVDLAARITARRQPGGNCSAADYIVVNNPNRLTDSEWERVIAVICSGKEWQFRNWPFDGIVDTFRKVQGFYFHYDDVTPPTNVSAWAIKLIPLSRTKRHTDGHAQAELWKALDMFMKRHPKNLRY